MIIWILDCATCYCTKVRLSAARVKELENKFGGCVEDFLYNYESELGINMPDCSWMSSDEDLFDEVDF